MRIGDSNIVIYIIGIIILFLFGRMFIGPTKFVAKFLYSTILGGVAILIINAVGKAFCFNIPLNPANAFIIGTLGIPGFGLIIALKNILSM